MSNNYPSYPYSSDSNNANPYGDPFSTNGSQIDATVGAGRRFLGYLVDSILTVIVTGILSYFIFKDQYSDYFDQLSRAADSGGTETADVAPLDFNVSLGTIIILVLVWLIYRVSMETSMQGTIGKLLTGTRVVAEDGSPITATASVMRNSWYIVAQLFALVPTAGSLITIIILIAVGVSIAMNNQHQSFTDKWAKAKVVEKSSLQA